MLIIETLHVHLVSYYSVIHNLTFRSTIACFVLINISIIFVKTNSVLINDIFKNRFHEGLKTLNTLNCLI